MKSIPNFTSTIHVRLSIDIKSKVRELDSEKMRLRGQTRRGSSSQERRYMIVRSQGQL